MTILKKKLHQLESRFLNDSLVNFFPLTTVWRITLLLFINCAIISSISIVMTLYSCKLYQFSASFDAAKLKVEQISLGKAFAHNTMIDLGPSSPHGFWLRRVLTCTQHQRRHCEEIYNIKSHRQECQEKTKPFCRMC